jgi:hypothetical protein
MLDSNLLTYIIIRWVKRNAMNNIPASEHLSNEEAELAILNRVLNK